MGLFDRHPAGDDFLICPVCESVLVSKTASEERKERAIERHVPDCVEDILKEIL